MVRGEQLMNKWEMVSLFKLREPKKKKVIEDKKQYNKSSNKWQEN